MLLDSARSLSVLSALVHAASPLQIVLCSCPQALIRGV